ncbi:MAG TPA: hypothetical protein VK705_10645 [Ferruginibacter sp.]|jgi:hypothetical protein|nr:hypothetical protein [Ferruginibacter sp.]
MEESRFTINKRQGITFEDNNLIPFHNIKDHLLYNNILIVVGYIETGSSRIDNVYGIDIVKKKIVWQIKNNRREIPIVKTLSGSDFKMPECYFTDLSLYENKVSVRNICNFMVLIDEQTGEIKETHQLNDFK